MNNSSSTARLLAFIDSHDVAEPTRINADGSLHVACVCVNTNLPEGYNGRVFTEYSDIPATLSAARDWLGY